MEDRGFKFNQIGKTIEENLKPKENHLKNEEVQDDLIVKIIEIIKLVKEQIILDRSRIEPLDQFGMKEKILYLIISY